MIHTIVKDDLRPAAAAAAEIEKISQNYYVLARYPYVSGCQPLDIV